MLLAQNLRRARRRKNPQHGGHELWRSLFFFRHVLSKIKHQTAQHQRLNPFHSVTNQSCRCSTFTGTWDKSASLTSALSLHSDWMFNSKLQLELVKFWLSNKETTRGIHQFLQLDGAAAQRHASKIKLEAGSPGIFGTSVRVSGCFSARLARQAVARYPSAPSRLCPLFYKQLQNWGQDLMPSRSTFRPSPHALLHFPQNRVLAEGTDGGEGGTSVWMQFVRSIRLD